ncbi:MAG: hypothetical protein P4L27_07930 [Ignavibacteriaceae bacterium]|nr:hypothetical protein [Ignavibacteriaceae bacterium]
MTQNTDHVEITNQCVCCDACNPVCPQWAISSGNNGKYVVDSTKCYLTPCLANYANGNFYNLPCVSVCPTDAIVKS